jgi:tetratricopeptide (TPR) repeat protein
MKRKLLILSALFAFVAMELSAASSVLQKKGHPRENVDEISADSNGNLTVKSLKNGRLFTTKVKKGDYDYAWVPMSKGLKSIEKKIEGKDYNGALEAIAKYHDKYKYLGWDLFCIYMKALAEAKSGKSAEAIKTLQGVESYEIKIPPNEKYLLDSLKLLANLYIDAGNYAKADAVLEKIAYSKHEETAAYALNAQGEVLNRQGKKKDALVKYMQTVKLFPSKNPHRAEALCKLANLLKESNDTRSSKFAAMLKKEYPGSPWIKQLK